MALGAAWYGGERFILRQVRTLSKAVQLLGAGDLSSRTGLAQEQGELGELARTFDAMAASLEQRVKERERAEKALLNRAFQQTVVAALGQFAMVSNDIATLLNQAVMLVAQTLELEYCHVLELQPGGKFLLLRAGVGWKSGCVGKSVVPADPQTESGFTLTAGEALVFEHLPTETRFHGSSLLVDHGVISGITVAIAGHGQAFGMLGAHTAVPRKFTEDEIHFLFSLATVLAMAVERIRTEVELQKLAAFARLNPNPAMELAADGTVTYFNDAALSLAGSVGHNNPLDLLPPNVRDIVRHCLETGQHTLDLQTVLSWTHPFLGVPPNGHQPGGAMLCRGHYGPVEPGSPIAASAENGVHRPTGRRRGARFQQHAHRDPGPLRDDAGQEHPAARDARIRASDLLRRRTRRHSDPAVTHVQPQERDAAQAPRRARGRGHPVENAQRLLGETITLEFNPPPELPLVQADPGMVEQVIMNLAVNARDAMPNGGALTISTNPVEMNDAYVQTHPEARLGAFVCLRVSDTGCGMDSATLARIFEPFFTTKEVGKGTGLGLATVYGIVKQHEGWVEVSSEAGHGTTFNVFFPASSEPVKAPPPETSHSAKVRGGHESILVVEDEPVLRDMAHLILQDCGYHVLEAGSGAEALQVWERNPGAIDLMLTDVVMPGGMSGRELAAKLLASHPQLKIIFTSGYSVEETNTDFFRRGGAVFLQKPYTRTDLAKAVRERLDKRPESGA